MNRRTHSGWLVCLLLLGISVLILEMDVLMSMSQELHNLLLIIGILLLLTTGATYLYQRAKFTGNSWWQDDDWTHWGGI